jgi:hypothetical protein
MMEIFEIAVYDGDAEQNTDRGRTSDGHPAEENSRFNIPWTMEQHERCG